MIEESNAQEIPTKDEYLSNETVELMQNLKKQIEDARNMLNSDENVEDFFQYQIEEVFRKYKRDMEEMMTKKEKRR